MFSFTYSKYNMGVFKVAFKQARKKEVYTTLYSPKIYFQYQEFSNGIELNV